MHPAASIEAVLALRARGLGARRISARTGVPIRTVTDWINGRVPRATLGRSGACGQCGASGHGFADLPRDYSYLLGLYLGDGSISSHPRGVYRLRVTLDAKYPGIVDRCAAAMRAVFPSNSVHSQPRDNNCIVVSVYSRQLTCLFPQHGPGRKHNRAIELAEWRWDLVALYPEEFIRGLIESDGCRFQNTGRGWSHPRYAFKNLSADIRAIFMRACALLDLHCTTAGPTVYVSRKADVARLDEFVGPKA